MKLYYHSGNSIGQQTYAYATAASKQLLGIDISKTKVTATQWVSLADELNVPLRELISTDIPLFRETYGDGKTEMTTDDWLKILDNTPELLRYPILIKGDQTVQIKTGAQFKEYMEPDSAGLEKPYNK